jgi:type IV secretory pathway VirB10-like protein
MTKRTAMLMAAGVVAALFAGSIALAFGLSGNTAASADSPKPDPIVRTVHRTVRVEKEAKPANQPVQVVTLGSATAPAASSDAVQDESDDSMESQSDDSMGSDDSDDAYEDESDDQYEDESDDQYEDEDHESEDQSGGVEGEEDEPEDD